MNNYDVAIIGGGPGGYVCAIKASQLGLKTVVIEKEQNLGGICLNWGCIPTKALLHSAELYHSMQHAKDFGIITQNISFDCKKVVEQSRNASAKLSGGITSLMKKHNIDIIHGKASLNGDNNIFIQDENNKTLEPLSAKNIVIATGARAREIKNLETDKKQILSYKEALVPQSIPKSLLIVGSGAIGMEFATFYHRMGSKVTVIEMMDRVMPNEDDEISNLIAKSFSDSGVTIHVSTKLKKFIKNDDNVISIVDINGQEKEIVSEKVIMAAGVQANIEGLGLESYHININKGFIETNDYMQTDTSNIYAIGDVTSPPWLAHKASHEAIIVAQHIIGSKIHKITKENIPACTFCSPQVASVGLTEKQAVEKGYKINVGKFPFVGNGKALILGYNQGLIKTIFDSSSGKLLGAHMIGEGVTELISNFVLGKEMEATELDFMNTIFPHPTMSEMIHESVLDAFDQAIHI